MTPVPAESMRRSVANAMSGLCIGNVHVPAAAILRTYGRPPLDEADFPKWRVPHPLDVIVVGVRNAMSMTLNAWFVRFSGAPSQLVRLPWGVAHQLSTTIAETPELRTSTLFKFFPECYFASPTDDFNSLAAWHFSRKSELLSCAAEEQPRSLAPGVHGTMRMAPVDSVCAICLEGDDVLFQECCVPVCETCHWKLRSRCPVCDRATLNELSTCTSCMDTVPFTEHGYSCMSCQRPTLCARCWCDFGECAACEPHAIIS